MTSLVLVFLSCSFVFLTQFLRTPNRMRREYSVLRGSGASLAWVNRTHGDGKLSFKYFILNSSRQPSRHQAPHRTGRTQKRSSKERKIYSPKADDRNFETDFWGSGENWRSVHASMREPHVQARLNHDGRRTPPTNKHDNAPTITAAVVAGVAEALLSTTVFLGTPHGTAELIHPWDGNGLPFFCAFCMTSTINRYSKFLSL